MTIQNVKNPALQLQSFSTRIEAGETYSEKFNRSHWYSTAIQCTTEDVTLQYTTLASPDMQTDTDWLEVPTAGKYVSINTPLRFVRIKRGAVVTDAVNVQVFSFLFRD